MHLERENHDQAFFGHPKPLSGLFFTELWERFSFYGIRPLLILYMSALVAQGGLGLDRPTSAAIVGLFGGSLYLITILGGWVADNWLGQSRSVWYGSLIIALGHLSIALTALFSPFFFYLGLILIVIGTGLFKTCISVIVGTLYAAQDSRRDAGFSIFYMGINLGALVSPLISGLLVENYGWHWGFAVGGIGMLVALAIFRLISVPQLEKFDQAQGVSSTWQHAVNQNTRAPKIVALLGIILIAVIALVYFGIIHINPVVVATYLTAIIVSAMLLYFGYYILIAKNSAQDKKQLFICLVLLLIAALFWSAFEQTPTSLNLFAQDFTDRNIMGYEVPVIWFQSINSVFIIIFAPLFAWLWVHLSRSQRDPSYITKFILALALAAIGFYMMVFASKAVIAADGALVSPLWLVATLLFLTFGELCLSPVGLSTMTKLAPTMLRGQIMGLWFTAAALGNVVAGLIGGHVSADNLHDMPTLFLRCTIALVLGAMVLWLFKKPLIKLISKPSDSTTTLAHEN
jgi:proton-dependent oligopeptide transporter, POT family